MSTSDRLWTRLYGTWKGSPRRASRMTGKSGQARKYTDIKLHGFSRAMLADHVTGRETYAATLGAAGAAWAGCKDYDQASEAVVIDAQDDATARGIITVAFLLINGGHLWTFYDRAYPEADIRAQLRTIPRRGKGEDYPSGNPIRLPFGYHKVKKTRGVMRLPDGRRFDLDTPEGLAAGIDAFLALPLNGKPEAQPAHEATNGGAAWGDAYKPDEWKDLPAGGPLWRSPYLARAASTRPDLAKLQRGERVTLIKETGERDDTDSAQVAALAYNLSSADVDQAQARAMADYLKPQLRPGKTLEHYRAHFAAEWERYKPAYYTGRVIRILGPADGDAPQPLREAEHKAPRKSRARKDRPQKVAGALGYLEWLRGQVDPQSDTVLLSQRQCAERLGCNVRTIKRYEQQLGGKVKREVFARRQAGCLFILAPDVVPTSLADVVTADVVMAHPAAENAAPAPMQEEHPAPLVPSPAGAEPDEWAGIDAEIAAWEQTREGRSWQRWSERHRDAWPIDEHVLAIGRGATLPAPPPPPPAYRVYDAAECDAWLAEHRRTWSSPAEFWEHMRRQGPHTLTPAEQAYVFSYDNDDTTFSEFPDDQEDRGAECSTPPVAASIDPSGVIDRLKRGRDLRQGASGYD